MEKEACPTQPVELVSVQIGADWGMGSHTIGGKTVESGSGDVQGIHTGAGTAISVPPAPSTQAQHWLGPERAAARRR